jgi:hypothetical protein
MDGATVTLWVKKEGDADFAEVVVDSTMSVARLKKKIVKELGMTERLSTLILYMTNSDGKDLGAALDSRATVAAARLEDGASIVIKATGAATAPGAAATAGAHSRCAVQSSVQGGRLLAATLAVCRAAGRVGERTLWRVFRRQTGAHCCTESDGFQFDLVPPR